MSLPFLIVAALSPVFLVLFMRCEDKGRPEIPLLTVVGTLLLEALLYPSQNSVAGGIFHPSAAGQSMRLPEIIIPIALLARVLVRGGPRRLSLTAGAWTTFLLWYTGCFVAGLLQQNSFDEAFFQAKAIVYLGGGFALAAGVPPRRLVPRRPRRVLAVGLGILVVLFTPLSLASSEIALGLPLVPGASLGRIGADASTIITSIAVVLLLLEATQFRRRARVAIALVPAVLSPFVATQRAAIVGLAACVIFLALASFGKTWHARIRATAMEAVLLVCILLVPVLLTTAVRAAQPPSATSGSPIPYAGVLDETFFAERKAQSAQTRENLWREGLRIASDHPMVGSGLGETYDVRRASNVENLVGGGFHNILVDVLVRSGMVGIVLFLASVGLSLRDGVFAWRRHQNRAIATLSLALTSVMVGLLAKGMVESIFEKFRLATLLGLLLGLVTAAACDARRDDWVADPDALLEVNHR
jgi:hypothetical protein